MKNKNIFHNAKFISLIIVVVLLSSTLTAATIVNKNENKTENTLLKNQDCSSDLIDKKVDLITEGKSDITGNVNEKDVQQGSQDATENIIEDNGLNDNSEQNKDKVDVPKESLNEPEECETQLIISPNSILEENEGKKIFGFDTEGTSYTNIENRIAGSWGEVIHGNGTAENIKAFLCAVDGYGNYTGSATAGLYTYVNNDDAGELLLNGQTEEKQITINENTTKWIQFNFTNKKPTIVNGTKYFCMISLENTCGNAKLMAKSNDPGYSIYKMVAYSSTLPSLLVDENGSSYHRSIYCSYIPVQENRPPVANNDYIKLNEDHQNLKIDVMKNDFDYDGDEIRITNVSEPYFGRVEIIYENNAITVLPLGGIAVSYTPNKDYFGEDKFQYTITDGKGNFAEAIVYLKVNPINDPPVAVDDKSKCIEDTQNHIIDVLKNDYDIEGDFFDIFSISKKPEFGEAEIINKNNMTTSNVNHLSSYISYTPNRNFFGEDKFIYSIRDKNGAKSEAIVYISVEGVNDPPFVPNYIYPENGSKNIEINVELQWLGGDPDGDNVTYDVYLYSENLMELRNGNQKQNNYHIENLEYDTKYFWKVVARDEHGEETEGPIWNFKTLKKSDSQPGGSSGSTSGGSSLPENKKPIADLTLGLPYLGFIDESITFDGSLSCDPDGEIVEYEWSFGDGAYLTGEIVSYSFDSQGIYTVSLKVTDDKGGMDINKTLVEIFKSNIPPNKPKIFGYKTIQNNEAYSFAVLSDDLDKDKLKYIFDWGDGTRSETEFLDGSRSKGTDFRHIWKEPGEYTITIIVSDNQSTSTNEMNIIVEENYIEYYTIILIGLLIAAVFLSTLFAIKLKDKKK